MNKNEAAHSIVTTIKNWDKDDVRVLRDLINKLSEHCKANDLDEQHYLDMSSLPSVQIPEDVDTSYPVWAMDKNNNLLIDFTGINHSDILSLEEYREKK